MSGRSIKQIRRGKFPIRQLIDHRVDVIGPPVLVVQIIGVFPHIDHHQRPYSSRKWSIRVVGFHHFEFRAVKNQPGPPASELGNSLTCELLLASAHATKCRFHLSSEDGGWLTTAFGLQTLPVERV